LHMTLLLTQPPTVHTLTHSHTHTHTHTHTHSSHTLITHTVKGEGLQEGVDWLQGRQRPLLLQHTPRVTHTLITHTLITLLASHTHTPHTHTHTPALNPDTLQYTLQP